MPEETSFMQRASWREPVAEGEDTFLNGRSSWVAKTKRLTGRRLSIASRRSLVNTQAEQDRAYFDYSLGGPLGSYEDATEELMGAKALQCWRLQRHGLLVPPAFVVPTYVYSLHIEAAGVSDLISKVFSSDLRDPEVRKNMKPVLEKIRKKIISTELDAELIDYIQAFILTLGSGVEFAVRSSGCGEDSAEKSFAGQYRSYLFKKTLPDIVESIKKCWASMYKSHILEYASSTKFINQGKNGNSPERIKPPKMGVIIMKMVDAKSSGVCFTQNLWGSKSEVMVEAVMGLGKGLTDGEITPDRYVLDKDTAKTCYKDVKKPTHMYQRSATTNEIEKVEVHASVKSPILNPSTLKAIVVMARQVEEYYHQPQDIEWAVGACGSVYLLQCRPVTTHKSIENQYFLPPGEGFWTFDPTHFPIPVSPHFQDSYNFGRLTERSRRTGCLLETIELKFVHGFGFQQPNLSPPTPALERAAYAYWNKKLYEDDYREFCDFFRPSCLALQNELLKVNPSSLSHDALVKHVARCFDLAEEFWRLHHTYLVPTYVIVGDYMNRMADLTGKHTMETLCLLETASPESRGLLNREDDLLYEMYEMLRNSEEAMALLQCEPSQAAWALDCLLHMPGYLGEVMREVSIKYGWRLVGNYDLVTPSLIETPDFFLKTLYIGTKEEPNASTIAENRVRKLADKWKRELPEDKYEEFEDILDVGRKFFRIRDEQGLCTDLSGIGLCRRGILEGGKRLEAEGVIYSAEHLCVARKHEAIALLRGDLSLLSQHSSTEVGPFPTPRELKRRYDYIFSSDPNLVPRALGTKPPHPDRKAVTPNIRRTMAALGTGLLKGVWYEGRDGEEGKDTDEGPGSVKGVSASSGTIEGRCCLVLNHGDLKKVRKGDIVVTFSCSASFNAIIGLCAGICTDYGGMLSHAAIVAREYGIPAIVGTQNATKKFKDGDVIRVDSTTGGVTRIEPIQ